jgi:uncharacterized protein Veg
VKKSTLVPCISLFIAVLFSTFSPAIRHSYAQATTEQVSVPKGTVLRVALSARISIAHIGHPVEATVVEPVYFYERMVIPVHTKVLGRITALNPVPRGERIIAITSGDFTPLHDPVLQFDRLVLQESEIQINTEVVKRNTQIVTVRDAQLKDPSLFDEMKSGFRERLGRTESGPSRMDRFKNLLYSFLPYHPQVLDRGSLFDVVLQEPFEISVSAEEPVDTSHLGEPMPSGTLAHARLITALDSSETKEGTPVEAVLTEPIYGPSRELLYPEGTELLGSVVRVHSARWFSKGGDLRFAFHSLRLPAGEEQRITVQIGALEAQRGSNVTIDAEGGTKAHMSSRLLAPIYSSAFVGIGATSGKSRVKRAIASRGMGLIGRIAGTVGPTGVSTGLSFYGAARSSYLHLLRKGPEAKFPTNTRLEIFLGPQSGTHLN